MRTYAISLKGSTQQERQELYDFLVSKKEPIYANTGLTKKNYNYNYFLYDTEYKNWTGSPTTNFNTISIDDFIAKFQEPKINIRSYCIDCKDSTYSERQQIIAYLDSISEPIYPNTAFMYDDNRFQKDNIFGYDSSGKWMTGVIKSSYTLTTKKFMAKFINTRDTMSTINVGDVYLNSANKTCTILSNSELSNIMYKHEDGKNYTTSSHHIAKNWTKQIANYKIDKVKLKPGIVIPCDTFEKALAITTAMDNPMSNTQFKSYPKIAIYICNGRWEYCKLSYYEDKPQKYTIIPFESVLLDSTVKPTTSKFKVGDKVVLRTDVTHNAVYNGTIFTLSEHKFTKPLTVVDLWGNSNQCVKLSNGLYYGIDALNLKITKDPKIKNDGKLKLIIQDEPKSIKKEESFMSKLKATAITTIDQNKEAAIIAAKMEAGRVINKQVIKQAAKHVPFWAKGYLDTPLAPVVLANAVAMLGNHTGNAKVQKVSELMLLAAADVTVQSFNLDQIIDDILSGIKLPAGILDDVE